MKAEEPVLSFDAVERRVPLHGLARVVRTLRTMSASRRADCNRDGPPPFAVSGWLGDDWQCTGRLLCRLSYLAECLVKWVFVVHIKIQG